VAENDKAINKYSRVRSSKALYKVGLNKVHGKMGGHIAFD
jgi:hypothetical protein